MLFSENFVIKRQKLYNIQRNAKYILITKNRKIDFYIKSITLPFLIIFHVYVFDVYDVCFSIRAGTLTTR